MRRVLNQGDYELAFGYEFEIKKLETQEQVDDE